jgi:MFS family permease
MLFSIAMTIGRLSGDRIVSRAGNYRVLLGGGALAVAGFVLLLTVPAVAMAGFLLIGFGASNIVPVLFSLAGRQNFMPTGLAVAAVTTTGYGGILVGPPVLGFIAHATSLPAAFWALAVLMALVPLCARRVTKGSTAAAVVAPGIETLIK